MHVLLSSIMLLFMTVHASSTTTTGAKAASSTAQGAYLPFIATHSDVLTKRSLRSVYTDTDEERAPGASSIESLVNTFKSLKVPPQTIKSWMQKGNFADEQFKTLKLDKALDTVVDNSQFTTWVKYVDDFNEKHPANQVSIYQTLSKYYADASLLNMIEKAQLSPQTEKIATRLQSEQLQHWLSSDRSPKDIFRVLFKQVGHNDLFGNPNWSTWTKYVDDYNVLHPTKKTSVYDELAKRFSEEKLIAMIGRAKAVPSTESTALKVESAQCRTWLDRHASADEVFQVKFKLDKAGDKLFDDPHLITWVKYVNDLNKKYDEKTLVSSILTQHYGDKRLSRILEAAKRNPDTTKLASRVQEQQFNTWWRARKSRDNVYYQVLHIQRSDILLEDPLFITWLGYLRYYNNKASRKTSLIDSWLQQSLDKDVWFIIKSAKKVEKTKPLATNFEEALFNKFLTEKITPSTVSAKLHLGTGAEDKDFINRYTSEFAKTLHKVDGAV